jgi:hypothetical protein
MPAAKAIPTVGYKLPLLVLLLLLVLLRRVVRGLKRRVPPAPASQLSGIRVTEWHVAKLVISWRTLSRRNGRACCSLTTNLRGRPNVGNCRENQTGRVPNLASVCL